MTVPQHLHASRLKAGNWSQLPVVWAIFPSAALRTQDGAAPVIKSEKRTAVGSQTCCSGRGDLLHLESQWLLQDSSSGKAMAAITVILSIVIGML